MSSIGLYTVKIGNASNTYPLFGGQDIIEQMAIDRDFSTFIKTRKQNITFTLTFSLLENKFTPDNLMKVGNFFAKSKPIQFKISYNMNKMLWVIPVNSIDLTDYGILKGHFDVEFKATSPYWLTLPIPMTYTANEFIINNISNIQKFDESYNAIPQINIKCLSDGDLNIQQENIDMGINKTISFKGVTNNENIYMNGKLINSDKQSIIFNNWNKEEFILYKNINNFRVNLACEITVLVQYPIW